MTNFIASFPGSSRYHHLDPRIFLFAVGFILIGAILSFAQVSTQQSTFVVEDAPDQEIVCYGKTVLVKGRAQGVLAIGGDVIVEGEVSGDVGSIGGSVIHKEGAYIGGDVLIIGGTYKPESVDPRRAEGKKTVMYAGYEEELRRMTLDPTVLFSPSFSLSFLAHRILSVLFWFVISLGLATIAPGAVSRAVARFQLSMVKLIAIGAAAFLATTIGVIGSLKVLPSHISVIVGIMAFVLMLLAYVFGRVTLSVALGKILQKHLLKDRSHSETLAILIGVVTWTVLLSIPYLWTIALFVLFAGGLGLVLSARSQRNWQTP